MKMRKNIVQTLRKIGKLNLVKLDLEKYSVVKSVATQIVSI